MSSKVPKFTSFRPKPKPPEESQPTNRKTENRDKPTSDGTAKSQERTVKPRDAHKASQKSFFSDRRGDPDILKYGSLDRHRVPIYRRYGHGHVLGLSLAWKIDQHESTDNFVVLRRSGGPGQERMLTSRSMTKVDKRPLKFVKAAEGEHGLDADFIPFPSGHKRNQGACIGSEPEMNYRGLGSSETAEASDPDVTSESEEEPKFESEATKKNSILTQVTREKPNNAQAWLELVQHQEAMMKWEHAFAELSSTDRRHLADIRISLYEQALKNIDAVDQHYTQLQIGLLKEASRIWDRAKLANKWKDALAKRPQDSDLWIAYLDFLQSDFANFKYETCRTAFVTCLSRLQASSDSLSPEMICFIFIRLTSMMHDTGYQELALAIWQALLEYYFLRPQNITSDVEGMRLFEQFWDSEVPRIGELGAKGWCHSDLGETPPPSKESPIIQSSNELDGLFEKFCKQELDATERLQYPGRTTDEVDENDVFHLVFFSDVKEYLKFMPQTTSRNLVLNAFLCFCRLPCLPQFNTDSQKWWSHPFLQPRFNEADYKFNETSSFIQLFRKYSKSPLPAFRMTTELLFQQAFAMPGGILDTRFIRRLLKLIATEPRNDDLVGEYLLAFELRYFPKEAFKTAKQLLKTRPTSLCLYNAYGLVESQLGNLKKADQVFSMALSMQKDKIPLATPESLQLFSSWVCEALRRGSHTDALRRLVSPQGQSPGISENDEKVDQVTFLRTKAILNDASERALLGQDYNSAVIAISLLAFLVYLSNIEKPDAALTVHHGLTTWFARHNLAGSPAEELHAQSIAYFLAHHSIHAPIVKPALLRTNLEPLISLFPNNTCLLALYAANEARFSIDDRVRGAVQKKALQRSDGANIFGWVFLIHYEVQRSELSGSTSHSIRGLYKRATESEAGAHCPSLWRAYLAFEIEQLRREKTKRPNKRPRRDGKKSKYATSVEEAEDRVKDTFMKGLTMLPWCKDYIMLAFASVREENILTQEELRRCYSVMIEKEMRIHVEMKFDAS